MQQEIHSALRVCYTDYASTLPCAVLGLADYLSPDCYPATIP